MAGKKRFSVVITNYKTWIQLEIEYVSKKIAQYHQVTTNMEKQKGFNVIYTNQKK